MIWTPINTSEITTYNPIYFSEKHSSVCEKVCDILHIDCFPAIDELAYYKLNNNQWSKKNFDYDITEIEQAFDLRLLEKFALNDSNIVFTHKNNLINGVIHFTNYESPNIYSTIYHNLNVFEKNLRNHLYEMSLDDLSLIAYYENYKLKKERKKERIQKRIYQLKNSKEKRPFENTFLTEIIDFSISNYHSKESLSKFGTLFFKKEVADSKNNFGKNVGQTICLLRNFIMHHDNISGESVFTPHNFEEFQKFFVSVNTFKNGFESLRKERLKLKLPNLVLTNNLRLEIIGKLENKEISNYFYN
jgi:hypothetical protein